MMTEKKILKLYDRVLALKGVEQVDKAIEECSELIDALCKFKQLRATEAEVITEIADVMITTEQMARLFGIEDVMAERERKLERLNERLKEWEKDLNACRNRIYRRKEARDRND